MRTLLLVSLAAGMAAQSAPAQDTALAARIRRVENGLTTPVIVAGGRTRARPSWTGCGISTRRP